MKKIHLTRREKRGFEADRLGLHLSVNLSFAPLCFFRSHIGNECLIYHLCAGEAWQTGINNLKNQKNINSISKFYFIFTDYLSITYGEVAKRNIYK